MSFVQNRKTKTTDGIRKKEEKATANELPTS
jgi:hypothetical protein